MASHRLTWSIDGVTDQLDRDFADLDREAAHRAERARARGHARTRRETKREHHRESRRRLRGSPASVPALAVAGTVALVAMLWASGGDLSGWPYPLALAAVAAIFVAPAVLAWRLARAGGAVAAAAAALTTLGLQLTLTFFGAFLLLHAGPS